MYEDAQKKWKLRLRQAVARNNLNDTKAANLAVKSWDEQVAKTRQEIDTIIGTEYLKYPPQHARHFVQLTEFHQTASYDKSVVIMTKFPDGNKRHVDYPGSLRIYVQDPSLYVRRSHRG
jgi:hypothetical protein